MPADGAPHITDGSARPLGVAVTTRYLPELEALRGIAIALVVALHVDGIVRRASIVGQQADVSLPFAFVRAGFAGVDLFFVLSAFLLSQPFFAAAAGGPPVSIGRYFARRALRILPLYWTVVLVTFAGNLAAAAPHLLFLSTIPLLSAPPPSSAGTWWSLDTEVQFYLLLPLLGWALRSRTGRAVALALVLSWAIAYGLWVSRILQAPGYAGQLALGSSLFGRAPLFLFGMGAAWLFQRRGAAMAQWMRARAWLRRGGADALMLAAWLLLALLLQRLVAIGGIHEVDRPTYHFWHLAGGLLWSCVLLLLVLAPLQGKPLLVNRAWIRLGILSYSIYLLHLPLLQLVLARFRPTWLPLEWDLRTAAAAALACAACVGLSALTYQFIERPFLTRKERLG